MKRFCFNRVSDARQIELKRLSPNGEYPITEGAAGLHSARSRGADLGIEDTSWGPVGTQKLPYAAGSASDILGESAVSGPAGEPQPKALKPPRAANQLSILTEANTNKRNSKKWPIFLEICLRSVVMSIISMENVIFETIEILSFSASEIFPALYKSSCKQIL